MYTKVNICVINLSFQVQDPPMFISLDIRRGDTFDEDLYKAYTKSGKTVEFVVWPVLLLHKTGPILCKGVAQGIPDYSSRPKSATNIERKHELRDVELDIISSSSGRQHRGYKDAVSVKEIHHKSDTTSYMGKSNHTTGYKERQRDLSIQTDLSRTKGTYSSYGEDSYHTDDIRRNDVSSLNYGTRYSSFRMTHYDNNHDSYRSCPSSHRKESSNSRLNTTLCKPRR